MCSNDKISTQQAVKYKYCDHLQLMTGHAAINSIYYNICIQSSSRYQPILNYYSCAHAHQLDIITIFTFLLTGYLFFHLSTLTCTRNNSKKYVICTATQIVCLFMVGKQHVSTNLIIFLLPQKIIRRLIKAVEGCDHACEANNHNVPYYNKRLKSQHRGSLDQYAH